MSRNRNLKGTKDRGLGKRKHVDDTNNSLLLPIGRTPGSQNLLYCKIKQSSLEHGCINFRKKFTKKLIRETLGFQKTDKILRFAISHSKRPNGKSEPAKFKLNKDGSSIQGASLLLDDSVINQLNLQPGCTLKMEYLYKQQGGGGKKGLDPVFHFTLESDSPSTGSKKRVQPSEAGNAAAAAAAVAVAAQEDTQDTGSGDDDDTSEDGLDMASVLRQLNIPEEDAENLDQPYTVIQSFGSTRLAFPKGGDFLKRLVEQTLGLTYKDKMSLRVCILVDNDLQNCVKASIATHYSHLTQWNVISSLLGGVAYGDNIIFTYLGKHKKETRYYFSLKKDTTTNDGGKRRHCWH